MQIQILIIFFLIFSSSSIQALEPSPEPTTGGDDAATSSSVYGFHQAPLSPPAPSPEAADGVFSLSSESLGAPAPVPGNEVVGDGDQSAGEILPTEDDGGSVRWCAVRDQVQDCQFLVSVINQLTVDTWKCVQRDKVQDCFESIKKGEADLVSLEAGLAYTAFIDHSMKAIANEIYHDHSKSYESVAVVRRKTCENNENLSLMDFKGHKSCHGGYSTAAGWNYPINYIKKFFDTEKLNDREIATSFFSAVCAPSEIEGSDIYTGCSRENGTFSEIGLYSGDSGAFRCLVEDFGDIAFVKDDTALLYSKEGPYSQSWSRKSIRDFMYLCPQGGCREINGYPGDCSFGAVPANVIMTHNSMPNQKRMHVLETLTNTSLVEDLYSPKDVRRHLFSPRTQGLAMIREVTRLYLGKSASVSQMIQKLNAPEDQVTTSTPDKVSAEASASSSCLFPSLVMTIFPLLMMLLILGVLTTK